MKENISAKKGSLVGVRLYDNIIPVEVNENNSRSDYFVTDLKTIKKINTLAKYRFYINVLIDSKYNIKEFKVPLSYKANESLATISAFFVKSVEVKTRSFQIKNSKKKINFFVFCLFWLIFFSYFKDRFLDINCWKSRRTFEKQINCSILVVAQTRKNSLSVDFGNSKKIVEDVYGI